MGKEINSERSEGWSAKDEYSSSVCVLMQCVCMTGGI